SRPPKSVDVARGGWPPLSGRFDANDDIPSRLSRLLHLSVYVYATRGHHLDGNSTRSGPRSKTPGLFEAGADHEAGNRAPGNPDADRWRGMNAFLRVRALRQQGWTSYE